MARSAREIDVDPRTYIGLTLPLRSDHNNNFAMTRNSSQQAIHNLKNLLLTSLRERPLNPMFGCRLKELCYEQIDEELPQKIEGEIKKAVGIWLPYITIISVNTLTKDGDTNRILVRIQFNTTLDPQTVGTLDVEPQ